MCLSSSRPSRSNLFPRWDLLVLPGHHASHVEDTPPRGSCPGLGDGADWWRARKPSPAAWGVGTPETWMQPESPAESGGSRVGAGDGPSSPALLPPAPPSCLWGPRLRACFWATDQDMASMLSLNLVASRAPLEELSWTTHDYTNTNNSW